MKNWRERYLPWLGYSYDAYGNYYYHTTLYLPRISLTFIHVAYWWGVILAPLITDSNIHHGIEGRKV